MRRVRLHRRKPIRHIWKAIKKRLICIIGVAALLLGVAILTWGSLRAQNTFSMFVDAFYSNAGTELISIAITVLVIDYLNRRRATNERKEELIYQMGSPNNEFAVEAVRILRLKGWFYDGSLKGASLWMANLRGAILNDTNLQGAYLDRSDLEEANLREANLQGTRMGAANLRGADLKGANLQEAFLGKANLQGADLYEANLQGSEGVTCDQLRGAATLEGTTLPDGTKLPGRTPWQKLENEPESPWREAFEAWCEEWKGDDDSVGNLLERLKSRRRRDAKGR
jgi:hypothetical protein